MYYKYGAFWAVSTRLWHSLFFFFFSQVCHGWIKMNYTNTQIFGFFEKTIFQKWFLSINWWKKIKKKQILIKKNLENSEKKIIEFFFWKHWKKCARKECGHFNEVGRKILLILFVLLVLPEINLWTRWNYFRFFFFIKEFMM